MAQFTDLDPFAARAAKLQALRDLGVEPYPQRVPAHQRIVEARTLGATAGETPEVEVTVVGRLKALRGQGALFFADLYDTTGKLQLLFKQDAIAPEIFEMLELLDLGDFISATGKLFMSRRGELTLQVSGWEVLSKALHPLPDLWKGLQDVEQRQRQRYAELIVSETAMDRFQKRSLLVARIRQFLHDHSFVEVETPVLEHTPGGADAEPFTTHHNALDTEFFLRISLELHLKRLVVGGFDRVFELGRVFRNEGMSPQHLQEFTMLEFYWAYASYKELMPFIQKMYQEVIQATMGTLQIERGEHILDFSGDWPVVSYVQLLKDYAGIDILEVTDEQLIEAIIAHGLKTGQGANQAAKGEDLAKLGRGRLIDMLYKKTARPHLIQPQFLVDFPVEFSPLTKQKPEDPRLTERVVVLIDGMEVGNGYTELNDPEEQRRRLEQQEALRIKGDAEAQRMDEDFITALSYGMPPTTGFGVSVDRLMVAITGVDSVRETVLFPTMRPEKKD
ncbi:lysine--tRNA ligase [soil metagenome]